MKAVPFEEEINTDVGFERSLDDGAMPRGRHDDDDGAAEQKTSDDDTFDSSSAVTTSSGSTHGQYKICISKKIMFALL